MARATRTRFTAGGVGAYPVWAPDGSKLAFQSTAPGPFNLFWKLINGNADAQPLLNASDAVAARSWPGTGAALLPGTLPTLSGAGPQYPMSWSPDGSAVAFHERKPDGRRDIWVVSPGGEPVPFLLTPFDERSPRFSPDGRWLAYVSDESGRDDVYVQPYPGPGPKWIVSTDGGIDPVWSKDGRELFYRRGDELMAVSVTAAREFSASRPTRLFETRFDVDDNGPNYDVSPVANVVDMSSAARSLMTRHGKSRAFIVRPGVVGSSGKCRELYPANAISSRTRLRERSPAAARQARSAFRSPASTRLRTTRPPFPAAASSGRRSSCCPCTKVTAL